MSREVNPRKAAVIGCGFVGSATAFTLMQSRLFSELVLLDVNMEKADGEAKDIAHGIPFAGQMKIYAGTYDDAADAAIIIITAGANQKPGETRLDLVQKNTAIYQSIIPEIVKRDFGGILLIVSNPVDISEAETAGTSASGEASGKSGIPDLADGSYLVEMTFEGGSGRASIASPVTITVENQKVTASVEWSSPNYDYMLVDGEKFLPVNTEGNSVFEIPVAVFDEPVTVIGDTVAMSKPHEIEYTLTFHSDTIKALD